MKTCIDCKFLIPANERHLDPFNSVCRIATCLRIRNACEDFRPKMETHRTCGECRNSKPYDEGEYPLLCKKEGVGVDFNECCSAFIPKQQRKTCENCKNYEPKNSVIDKLQAAAKKAATTGDRKDLQAYLRLRRGLL